jgi:PAS domain S-box-containing protein
MRRVRGPGAIVAFAAIVIVAIWAITLGQLGRERERAVADATRDTEMLAVGYEESVMRSIRSINQTLVFLRHEFIVDGPSMDLADLTQGQGFEADVMSGVKIADRNGYVVAGMTDELSVEKEDYFQAHVGSASDSLFIGKPRQDPRTGAWSMEFSRRIQKTDGSFMGVVSASVDPAHLTDFLRHANMEKLASVMVMTSDGTALVRRTGENVRFGEDLRRSTLFAAASREPAGSFLSRGNSDGFQRFMSYRRLPHLPLVACVGISTSEAFAAYERQTHGYLAFAAAATAFVAILAAILTLGLRRERDAHRALKASQDELRASEQQMRDITDALPVMIACFDGDMRMRYNNLACQEWFGPKSADLLGRAHASLFPDDADVEHRLDEVYAGYPVHYHAKLTDGRGQPRDMAMHYVPRYAMVHGEERICGYYALFTDITAFKRVDRMKNEFVSTVSHELRTPLTSIRGSLGLLAGGVAGALPGNAQGLVEIARTNCERLVRLINDILDVEKIESGKMRFDLQALEMKPLLLQAVAANEGFARQHGVALTVVAPESAIKATVDADRMNQVLTNLISNAVKFSPQGATVEVVLSEAGERLRVDVVDHGPGIPEEFRGRIFQKFSQADSSDTRQKGGSGLGLNISRAIIEHLGGKLGFTTETGVGTTFSFELARIVEAPVAPVPQPQSDDRPRVLVCEDHPDIARLIALMLDKAGYAADEAHTAAEARARLAERRYVAMTVDIQLPDEDGIFLIRRLRAAPATRSLPIVVVSAVANEGRIRLNDETLSVTDWLDKPIDETRLIASIERARGGAASRPCVLHVEDDPDVQRIAAAIARDFADFEFAGSLAEARERLCDRRFDLIVLDMALPDGSGWSLVDDLRRREPGVPIVVFTAGDLEARQADRVAAVLTKAQTSNELLAETLQRVLANPSFPPLAEAA